MCAHNTNSSCSQCCCCLRTLVRLAYQVDAASNQLANHLISVCGVCEGDVVGLMMQRSHNMVVSMLGILKAGGAYLPLDPGHPPSRTAFIACDAALKVRPCAVCELATTAPQKLDLAG